MLKLVQIARGDPVATRVCPFELQEEGRFHFAISHSNLAGAPEEIRTPDPQIRSLVFTSYMQFCARIVPVSKVENTRKSDAALVGPTQAAALLSEENRSYAARTASLP